MCSTREFLTIRNLVAASAAAALALVFPMEVAAQGVSFKPSTCKIDPKGMVHVTLFGTVFRFPIDAEISFSAAPKHREDWFPPAKHPEVSEGCPGNPVRAQATFMKVPVPKTSLDARDVNGPRYAPFVWVAVSGTQPGFWWTEPSDQRFATFLCRIGKQTPIGNGMFRCRNVPKTFKGPKIDLITVFVADPRVYTSPFQRRYVARCLPNFRGGRAVRTCRIQYPILKGVFVNYKLHGEHVRYQDLIRFDKSIRKVVRMAHAPEMSQPFPMPWLPVSRLSPSEFEFDWERFAGSNVPLMPEVEGLTCDQPSGSNGTLITLYGTVLRIPRGVPFRYRPLAHARKNRVPLPADSSTMRGCAGNPLTGHAFFIRPASASSEVRALLPAAVRQLDRVMLAAAPPGFWGLQIRDEGAARHLCAHTAKRFYWKKVFRDGTTVCWYSVYALRYRLARGLYLWKLPERDHNETSASYLFDAKHYRAPFNRPFIVACNRPIFPKKAGECYVRYKLFPTVNVTYIFERSRISIGEITKSDRKIRAWLRSLHLPGVSRPYPRAWKPVENFSPERFSWRQQRANN